MVSLLRHGGLPLNSYQKAFVVRRKFAGRLMTGTVRMYNEQWDRIRTAEIGETL
jgi:hypothetical protein